MNAKVENPRRFDQAMSLCFKNGIKIYPVPYGASRFEIVIERPGKAPKKSDEKYPEKATKHLPGIYDKILSLYQEIAAKLEKPQPVTTLA